LPVGDFDDRLNDFSVGLGRPIRKVVNRRCERNHLNFRDLQWVTSGVPGVLVGIYDCPVFCSV
jgi:hypothetical protein